MCRWVGMTRFLESPPGQSLLCSEAATGSWRGIYYHIVCIIIIIIIVHVCIIRVYQYVSILVYDSALEAMPASAKELLRRKRNAGIGWRYLSNATCLIRTRLFSTASPV